jgi:hypothetical protein
MAGPFGALGCIPDVVESIDPKTLEAKIAQSFARQLLANPASQFVELQSSGGGDGAVFQVTLYYSTEEDGNYPPLSDQNVKVVWGSDPHTVLAKLADFYAMTAVDRTTFVEKTSAGAGALWLDIVIYTLGEDEGLAALGLEDADEVAAGTFASPVSVSETERRDRVSKRVASIKAKAVSDAAPSFFREAPVLVPQSRATVEALADIDTAEARARELELGMARRERVAARVARKKRKVDDDAS